MDLAGFMLLLALVGLAGAATRRFYPGTVVRDYFEENPTRVPLDWSYSVLVSSAGIRMAPLAVAYGDRDFEYSFYEYPPKAAKLSDPLQPLFLSRRLPDVLDVTGVPRPLVVQFGARMDVGEGGLYSEGHVSLRLLDNTKVLGEEVLPQDDFSVLFAVVFSTEGEYLRLEVNAAGQYVGSASRLFVPDGDAHTYTLELSEPLPAGMGGRRYRMLRDGAVAGEGTLAELGALGAEATHLRRQSYFYRDTAEETRLFLHDYAHDRSFAGEEVDPAAQYGGESDRTPEGVPAAPVVDADGEPNVACLRGRCGLLKPPMRLGDDRARVEHLISSMGRRTPSGTPAKTPREEWTDAAEGLQPVNYMSLEAISSFSPLYVGGIYVGVEPESAEALRNLSYAPGVPKGEKVIIKRALEPRADNAVPRQDPETEEDVLSAQKTSQNPATKNSSTGGANLPDETNEDVKSVQGIIVILPVISSVLSLILLIREITISLKKERV